MGDSAQRDLLGARDDPCDSLDKPLEHHGHCQTEAGGRPQLRFIRARAGVAIAGASRRVRAHAGWDIIDFFAKPGDANRAGVERFPDGIFSIQEVTDEPIDLGFWSHVALH